MPLSLRSVCHVIISTIKAMNVIIYGVFIKNCVFSQFTANHPLHVGEIDLNLLSLLLADHFLEQPIAAQCWERRRPKYLKFLEKKKILNEHSVYDI